MMSKPQGLARHRLLERDLAGEDAGEIAARRAAELHIDIGEAEIAVEQQRLAPGQRQRMRQRDREPGLADPALAGGDGDDVALLRLQLPGPGPALRRRARRSWIYLVFSSKGRRDRAAAASSSRARRAGLKGLRPSAMALATPASAKPRRRRIDGGDDAAEPPRDVEAGDGDAGAARDRGSCAPSPSYRRRRRRPGSTITGSAALARDEAAQLAHARRRCRD